MQKPDKVQDKYFLKSLHEVIDLYDRNLAPAHYQHVPFQRLTEGTDVRISGTVPATCSDFKIDRPSFLTVPIKNEIPVKVDLSWHRM